MIYKVEHGFVISADDIWLPGCYESEEAAKFAFEFCVDFQALLRDQANETTERGVITLAMMKELQATRGLSCGQGAHRPGWKDGDPIIFDDGR